jgi:hypothetical protein
MDKQGRGGLQKNLPTRKSFPKLTERRAEVIIRKTDAAEL